MIFDEQSKLTVREDCNLIEQYEARFFGEF